MAEYTRMTGITEYARLNESEQRFLNLWYAKYQLPNEQQERTWIFASRNNPPRLKPPEKGDAVVIVAFVDTAEGRRLLCTKEYRVPINAEEYGFPAGLIEPDEDTESAARRELPEETGLTVTKVLRVSPPIISSAGLSDESVQMVFVLAEGELSKKNLEDGEDIDSFLLTLREVSDLCQRQGKFAGVTIAAKAWPILLMLDLGGWTQRSLNQQEGWTKRSLDQANDSHD